MHIQNLQSYFEYNSFSTFGISSNMQLSSFLKPEVLCNFDLKSDDLRIVLIRYNNTTLNTIEDNARTRADKILPKIGLMQVFYQGKLLNFVTF